MAKGTKKTYKKRTPKLRFKKKQRNIKNNYLGKWVSRKIELTYTIWARSNAQKEVTYSTSIAGNEYRLNTTTDLMVASEFTGILQDYGYYCVTGIDLRWAPGLNQNDVQLEYTPDVYLDIMPCVYSASGLTAYRSDTSMRIQPQSFDVKSKYYVPVSAQLNGLGRTFGPGHWILANSNPTDTGDRSPMYLLVGQANAGVSAQADAVIRLGQVTVAYYVKFAKKVQPFLS